MPATKEKKLEVGRSGVMIVNGNVVSRWFYCPIALDSKYKPSHFTSLKVALI